MVICQRKRSKMICFWRKAEYCQAAHYRVSVKARMSWGRLFGCLTNMFLYVSVHMSVCLFTRNVYVIPLNFVVLQRCIFSKLLPKPCTCEACKTSKWWSLQAPRAWTHFDHDAKPATYPWFQQVLSPVHTRQVMRGC